MDYVLVQLNIFTAESEHQEFETIDILVPQEQWSFIKKKVDDSTIEEGLQEIEENGEYGRPVNVMQLYEKI